MRTVTERRIVFTYGPAAIRPFEGAFSGYKTWDELEAQIRDDRWGSPYTVIKREERTVTYGDWENVRL